MKILHTSDWHLGVKTNGRDRLREQKKVIEEIISIANFENVDAVIVAGDVFNTSSPSAEAEELFFDAVEQLSLGGDRFVFVLAGNHDDPTRIEAGLPLASKHNIALVGDLQKLSAESFNRNSLVKVVETGKGYVKIQKGDELVTIAYLPYPNEARIKEKVESDLSYAEKVKSWADIGSAGFSDDSFNIFVSHIFMVGSKVNSGQVKVGDILAVPQNMLPKANYTALGHIHTPQNLGEGRYYSGAITRLSFGQGSLGVNIIDTQLSETKRIKKVELNNLARYEKVTAHSIEEASAKLDDFDDSDLVELEIVQDQPLSASSLKELKKNYACILNISLVRNFSDLESVSNSKGRRLLGDNELFKNFYKSVRGFDAPDELVELFAECIGGEDEAD